MPSFQAPSRPVLVHPPASPGCVMRGPLLLLVPSGSIKLDDLIQTICQQASGWFDGRRVSSNIFHSISHHENIWCCFPSYFATPFHPSIERNHLFWGPPGLPGSCGSSLWAVRYVENHRSQCGKQDGDDTDVLHG